MSKGVFSHRVVAVVVALMLAACLGTAGWAEGDAPPTVDLEIDDWFIPQGLTDIVARFRELEWSWRESDSAEDGEEFRVGYHLVGDGVVEGQQTTEVELVVNGDSWRIWLAPDGSVVQVEVDGELLPPGYAHMVSGPMLTGLFWPFTMVEYYGVGQALAQAGPGWEFHAVGAGVRQLGDLQVPVHEIQLAMSGPPHLAPGERVELVWTVADFGAFEMLVEWRVTEDEAAGVTALLMQVERVVLR
ncbi:MAG: hypothetical protein ACP5G2_06925 [Candidatus Bipolaricaulaceae bacterium]